MQARDIAHPSNEAELYDEKYRIWDALTQRGKEQFESYRETSRLEFLQEAVHCSQEAASMASEGIGDVTHSFKALGDILLTRFERIRDRADLDEALIAYQNTLDLTPLGHTLHAISLNNLANALRIRFELVGDRTDVDRAIVYGQNALDLMPSGHPDRSSSLLNLANAVLTRFEQVGDRADLDHAIILYQKALDSTSEDSSLRFVCLNDFANALRIRFEQIQDRTDLEQAIDYSQSALDLRPPDHTDRTVTFTNLANTLFIRFNQVGDRADLNKAIVYYQKALDLTSPENDLRSSCLNNFANALRTRFEQTGDRADLDQAIVYSQSAMDLTPHGHPNHAGCLIHFANALLIRFNQVGDSVDLDQAIAYYQMALDSTPQGHSLRFMSLNDLANALRTRFEQTGDRADLDQAIVHNQSALDLIPPGHSNYAGCLINLANALLIHFNQVRDSVDLDQAIAYYQMALDSTPQGHSLRFMSLNDLANALRTRFEQTGDRADLDQAIVHNRSALRLTPLGNLDRSASLINLAYAVLIRFNHFGDSADLDQAIVHHQSALNSTPPGHFLRSVSLNNLADALKTRFVQTGDRADLDQAIVYNQSALDLMPPGHPDRALSIMNLANTVRGRFHQVKDSADLDQAIVYYRDALNLTSPSHSLRSLSLLNLSTALRARFEQIGERVDVDQAIIYNRHALDLTSPGHPLRSSTLYSLATTLMSAQPIRTEDMSYAIDAKLPEHVISIISLLREAAATTTGGPPDECLNASLSWVDIAAQWSDPSAIEACRSSLGLLETVLATGRSLESRHVRISSVGYEGTRTLAVDGAAFALDAGQIEVAVELLEQGRSVLLTQAGKYRTRVDELRAIDPSLADEFWSTSRLMENSVISAGNHGVEGSIVRDDDPVASYQKLLQRWTGLVDRIRSLKGFEFFLQPTPFRILRIAAAHGPVIVLNISVRRSDAIIIHSHSDPILVPLPQASSEALARMAGAAKAKTRDMQFSHLLQELWKSVVQPVVYVLQNTLNLKMGSRIWWCPTGDACHLPLHAAGEYMTRGQKLSKLYISSYTTTLNSLIKAREQAAYRRVSNSQLLFIGSPDKSDQSKLLSVKEEATCLRRIFPSATILEAETATREAIISDMADHEWLHLTCHGYIHQEKPFKSHFAIVDGPLTLNEIVSQGLPKADLAFLSACHSAAGNRDRSDEALHLVAGLQFAGYRSVVGTLWEMADSTGPLATREFWSAIQRYQTEGKDVIQKSAHALHKAVNALQRLGVTPKVDMVDWACFVHYGC